MQHPRWSTLSIKAVNYCHKVLHLGCCNSPRSASDYINRVYTKWVKKMYVLKICFGQMFLLIKPILRLLVIFKFDFSQSPVFAPQFARGRVYIQKVAKNGQNGALFDEIIYLFFFFCFCNLYQMIYFIDIYNFYKFQIIYLICVGYMVNYSPNFPGKA